MKRQRQCSSSLHGAAAAAQPLKRNGAAWQHRASAYSVSTRGESSVARGSSMAQTAYRKACGIIAQHRGTCRHQRMLSRSWLNNRRIRKASSKDLNGISVAHHQAWRMKSRQRAASK